jgi:RNA polymerase sigma-70 factor (ECF subfamily)
VDNKIIQEVLSGNTEQFSILIDQYYNELFVFVHNQVQDINTTEDLLQEIFMKLYQKLNKFNPEKASFRTWMYRVSSNHCLDYHRKRKEDFIPDYKLDLLEDQKQNILSDMIQNEQLQNVLNTMKQILSKKQYNVLILQFFSNLTIEEIALSLDLAPKTIRNIISTSIKKIKDEMEVE